MIEPQEHSPEAERPAAAPAQDALRLSRRNAMKAAVGGAVAVGAFAAPRIEGFSLVPDYAAAASGDDQELTAGPIDTATSRALKAPLCQQACCVTCWNGSGAFVQCARATCTCGTHKTCGSPTNNAYTGSLVANKNSPSGETIKLDYSLWGPTEGCSNETPALNLALSGIDPPFQSCAIEVTGSCDQGTFVGGQASTAYTADTTFSLAPGCTGSIVAESPPVPDTMRCAAPARLTIKLSCTFS